ncbi:MAG: hypothetical protein A4E46_01521 [Methanosaeta sp. PtaU1.Bin016]|nr:MAG: hypothetical protein A4E46_01521 [Methanosaeta sp. PtaU1.Bin016]
MLHKWIVLRPYGLGQRLHGLVVGIDRVHMQLDDRFGLAISSLHLIYHIEIGLCVLDNETLASFSLYGLYIGTLGHHGLFYHLSIQFGHFFLTPHSIFISFYLYFRHVFMRLRLFLRILVLRHYNHIFFSARKKHVC